MRVAITKQVKNALLPAMTLAVVASLPLLLNVILAGGRQGDVSRSIDASDVESPSDRRFREQIENEAKIIVSNAIYDSVNRTINEMEQTINHVDNCEITLLEWLMEDIDPQDGAVSLVVLMEYLRITHDQCERHSGHWTGTNFDIIYNREYLCICNPKAIISIRTSSKCQEVELLFNHGSKQWMLVSRIDAKR